MNETHYDLMDQSAKNKLSLSSKTIYMYIQLKVIRNKSTVITRKELMTELNISKPTVLKALKQLRLSKLIKVKKRRPENTKNNYIFYNEYFLV